MIVNSNVRVMIKRLSGEEQADSRASEKYFNYINGGWLRAFC